MAVFCEKGDAFWGYGEPRQGVVHMTHVDDKAPHYSIMAIEHLIRLDGTRAQRNLGKAGQRWWIQGWARSNQLLERVLLMESCSRTASLQ